MDYKFRYIVERDADFAIINAFTRSNDIRQLFLNGFRSKDSKIIKVYHSYMQQEKSGVGESDIIFIMEDEKGKFGIFIEDKIKANAQPRQAERYKERADQLKRAKEINDYKIFLCAPQVYLSKDSENVKGYKDNLIAYERIVNLLEDGLDKSILAFASSDETNSDEGVTNFWNNMREFINTYYPNKLVMKGKSGKKPAGSMWQEFATDIDGCIINMKIDSRKIALEFKQMGPRLDELNALLNEYGIKHEAIRTNKGKSVSASIQFDIEEQYGLSFYMPFKGQEEKANIWIEKAIKLAEIANKLKENNVQGFPL